jgi:protein N-terminal methyltransferase
MAKKEMEEARTWNGEFFATGLQDFVFAKRYDVIWVQWVIIYLNDNDFVSFLVKAKEALNEGGMIVVKDNVCSKKDLFWLDKDDASVIRSLDYYQKLFTDAGLSLVLSRKQPNFPEDLFGVYTWVLK